MLSAGAGETRENCVKDDVTSVGIFNVARPKFFEKIQRRQVRGDRLVAAEQTSIFADNINVGKHGIGPAHHHAVTIMPAMIFTPTSPSEMEQKGRLAAASRRLFGKARHAGQIVNDWFVVRRWRDRI